MSENTPAAIRGWRVGDLARATGLTVRTLHHYDEIGLLTPADRSEGGHRLYGEQDVQRLYRIRLLRRLGLPLHQIAQALDDPAWSLRAALIRHRRELTQRIRLEQQLEHQLDASIAAIDAPTDSTPRDSATTPAAGLPHQLLQTLEGMTMLDTDIQRRISILVYDDIAAAHDYLVTVFGFGPGEVTRDADGRATHGEVLVGDGVIWLHRVAPEFGLQSPKNVGSSTGMTAVLVDDVDAHYARVREHGASVAYEPTNQPYGYREYTTAGPEGELWSFMAPLD